MRSLPIVTGALALGALSFVVRAQTPAPPTPTFRGGVELVQLDVTVLDKNKHPVRGLTSADFTITEGGKPRPIQAFSAVDLPTPVAPSVPWLRDVAPDVASNAPTNGRLVTVLLDRNIPPGQPSIEAKNIAKAAVEQLGPGDLGQVALTIGGIQQTYTTDRQRLLDAITRRDAGTEQSDDAADFDQALSEQFAAMGGTPGPPPMNGGCYCGLCTFEAVTNLAHAVRDVQQRRKTMVFVGHGFDMQPTDVDCVQRVSDARTAMFRELQAANVTIYTFDPVGLETLATMASSGLSASGVAGAASGGRGGGAAARGAARPAENEQAQGSLQTLAEQTGGRAFLNANLPSLSVKDVFRESGSYYLLGFEPLNPTVDSKFRKIDVKVKGKDLTVVSRKGYYTMTAEAEDSAKLSAAARMPLVASMAGLLPKTDMPVTITAAPFAGPNRLTSVVVVMSVSQPVDRTGPGAVRGPEPVDLLTAAFDALGRVRTDVRQTAQVTVPPNVAGIRYETYARLDLKPGRYNVRSAATVGGRTASAFIDIDVPDFTKMPLALSGAVLATGNEIDPAARQAVTGLLPFTPTAKREFTRGVAPIHALVRLYQGGAAPLRSIAVVARVKGIDDRAVFEQTATVDTTLFSGARAADFRFDVPVAELPPGQYLLTITAAAGKDTAERDVRFAVK